MATRNQDGRPPSLAGAWGRQLKLYREAAGLTQEQLAERIGYSRSTIANLEAGTFPPGTDVATALDAALDAGGRLVELRKDLVGIEIFGPWHRDWLEIERQATALRGSAVVLLPGLLQTPAYARVVLEGDEDRIASRLDRQTAIFDKDNPPTLRYVLDEHVLGRPIGGPEVMAEQMEHLEELVARGRAHVQVCPAGAVPSVLGAFDLATMDGESLGYLEAETQGTVLTKRHDVLALETIYEKILAEALPSTASLENIRRMKDQWKI